MPTIDRAREAIGQVFFQRCFYLFFGLLALLTAALFLDPTPRGRALLNAINLLLDVAAIAAVGRSRWSFIVATLLAIPAVFYQMRALITDDAAQLLYAWIFNAALYVVTIGYLMRYVFQRDVITADKLYGAAAGYLMLAALWAFGYSIVERLNPGSFSIAGNVTTPVFGDFLYFSVTTLTSTGFGDIVPIQRQARALCVLEQLTGALFLAILIARLAGVYPPPPLREPIGVEESKTPRFIRRLRERSRTDAAP
jgi:hypothetical protein